MRLDYPDNLEMHVNHETIYQSFYVQGRGELRAELARCLRPVRANRRAQKGTLPGRVTDVVMFSERPTEWRTNEETNVLLRRCKPKGTDLSSIPQ